jgi:hypothetical protein
MNIFGKLVALAALGMAVFTTAASADGPVGPGPAVGPAPAGPRGPNVMIAGEDADKDTIPRGNRSFNRIQRVIADQLGARGFHVFDEVAITGGIIPQGGVRRTLDTLLESAKVASAPIDVIVVFEIYGSVRPKRALPGVYEPFVRVDGRMISVRSGRDLGGYEFGSDIELPPLPEACVKGEPPNECLLESFGKEARLIGSAVGKALATKLAANLERDEPGLAALPPPGPVAGPGPGGPLCDGLETSYKLLVQNFSDNDLSRLEEAFTSFACYQHHRVMRMQPGVAEYWYETRADQARLARNMRFLLEYMNIPGEVTVTEGGSKIVLEKILLAPHRVITAPR